MEMKQMLLAVGVVAVLAGCGKDAGGYEGYWREKSDKKEGMIAVKKEKGNYFLNKIHVVTGKDGALSINTGIGEIPIKLSDDGKELYVERRQYVKTDAAMKDKIIAHQKKCGQTAQAYRDARNALPSNQTYQQHLAAIEQLKRRFEAEFDELEKEIKCNGRSPALLL